MGALTLLYVHFVGEERRTKPVVVVQEKIRKGNTTVVVLQRSSEYDGRDFLSVNNALAYARQTNADFIAIDREWGTELSQLTQAYPGGILLLDGTPRSRAEDVISLPLDAALEHDPVIPPNLRSSRHRRAVGVFFGKGDVDILISYCSDSYPGAKGGVTSALRACSKLKENSTVFADDSGTLLIP